MAEPTQIPDWLDHVGPGWQPILAQLHADVVAVEPTYSVRQVKEKFGSLRTYLSYDSSEVFELIRAAENQAETTCEECGNPGYIRSRRPQGRLAALCDLCVEKEEPGPW